MKVVEAVKFSAESESVLVSEAVVLLLPAWSQSLLSGLTVLSVLNLNLKLKLKLPESALCSEFQADPARRAAGW